MTEYPNQSTLSKLAFEFKSEGVFLKWEIL